MKFDIRKKINSNTIISFAAGVIFTILFNLVVNKEPFKIDSDSISALANVGTFIVALMAALQVKRWLDGKVNEAAFKQSQLIIEAISKINMSSRLILEDCLQLSEQKMSEAIADIVFNSKTPEAKALIELNGSIVKQIKVLKETGYQLEILTYELPMWNIELKNEEIRDAIQRIVASAFAFADKCESIEKNIFGGNNGRVKKLTDQIINRTHPLLVDVLDPILTKNYHDIFSPITSPSKKVEK
ncbi:TPA: hypothetical protein ACG1UU_002997 [Kluyvera ascorbata]